MSCCPEQLVSFGQKAANLRLDFVAGDDFPFRMTFNRNLTGYAAEADVVNPTNGSVLCAFAITTEYITVSGATHTRYTLSLTRQQTTTLAAYENARWSFRWTTPDNKKRTMVIGRVQAMKR